MIEPTSLPTDRELTQRSAAVSSEPFRGFDRPFARISWGSVFAGAMIALATQLVLTLIGAAIGLATLDPATGQSPSGTALGLGAAIWLVVTSLVSLFLGGFVSARLGGTFNGWLHGLTTWGTVVTMTMLLLTTAAGGLIGTASGLANFAVNNSEKTSQVSLPPAIQQQIDQFKARANQTADQVQQTTPEQQAADARQIGQNAAKGGAAGSGAAALGLILGALAAAFGGKTGQGYPIRDSYEISARTTRNPS